MAVDMTPRDKRLMTIVGVVIAIVLLVAIPVGTELVTRSREADIDELRSALNAVQDGRSNIHDRQARKTVLAQRYATRAPALRSFLEESAHKQKLELTEAGDRPEAPLGKKFVERHTDVTLKKAGLFAISKLLESIETSHLPVAITVLNLRTRSGEPDKYDVRVGVSAYDRIEKPQDPGDKSQDKDKKP